MINDLQNAEGGSQVHVDVCIVGGGAAGISLALRLAKKGVTYCVAEAGGLNFEVASQDLYGGDSIGHPMDPRQGRYRMFGGSTTQWGGRCAELDTLDFEPRPWVPNSGWPIRKSDLQPYYEEAKRALNFKAPWIADKKLLDDQPRLKTLDIGKDLSLYVWRVSSPDLRKTIKTFLKLGYHRNFDLAQSYIYALSAVPGSYIYLHANFVSFQAETGNGHVRCAEFRSLNGNTLTVTAKCFVLSASGIENARILLNSQPELLQRINRYDNIGRYFMQHPRGKILTVTANKGQSAMLQGTFNNFIRPPRYDIRYEYGFGLTEQAQASHRLLNASAALQYGASKDSPWAAGRRLRDNFRQRKFLSLSNLHDTRKLLFGAGSIIRNFLRKYVTGFELRIVEPQIDVVIDLEQEPNRDSRIMLSDKRDAAGLRRVTIDWKIGPMERRTARFLGEALADRLAAIGLTHTKLPEWLHAATPLTDRDLAGNYHFIGSTRMAATQETGVVDADCRVFGTDNLYAVGASVFPTGGHANPTLTIVALALRLGDHLAAKVADDRDISSIGVKELQDAAH